MKGNFVHNIIPSAERGYHVLDGHYRLSPETEPLPVRSCQLLKYAKTSEEDDSGRTSELFVTAPPQHEEIAQFEDTVLLLECAEQLCTHIAIVIINNFEHKYPIDGKFEGGEPLFV